MSEPVKDYAISRECSWHGPAAGTVSAQRGVDGVAVEVPTCPKCGARCSVLPEEDFWLLSHLLAPSKRYRRIEFLNWSMGRCFASEAEAQAAYARHRASHGLEP